MKVKYIIKRQFGEVPNDYKGTIRAGCLWDTAYGRTTFDSDDMEVFDSEEEALAALKKYKPEVCEFTGYWHVTEYYVQEVEFDEDEEEINVEYLEWAEMEFSVIEKPEGKTVGTFDNFGDALDCYDDMMEDYDYDLQDYDDEDYEEKGCYIEYNGNRVYGHY